MEIGKRPGPGDVEPPYFNALRNEWVGEKPPRRGPNNPPCKDCKGETEIHTYRHFDYDNRFHETVYRCIDCGLIFGSNEDVNQKKLG